MGGDRLGKVGAEVSACGADSCNVLLCIPQHRNQG